MNWATLADFPDYEVSDRGDVRRLTQGGRRYPPGYVLTPKPHQKGYLTYSLVDAAGRARMMLAHRLVALAFLGEPPSPLHEVAHKDGDKHNNALGNLRWSTPKDNQADRIAHGTYMAGDDCPSSKLSSDDVAAIRSIYRAKGKPYVGGEVTYRDLAAEFGISQAQVSRVVNGRQWA